MHRHRHRTLVGIVLVAAALGGAACGDDDEGAGDDTTTTEAGDTTTTAGGDEVSAEDFLVEANAVCASVNEDINALFTSDPTQLSEAEQAELATAMADVTRDGADQLEALEPPADVADADEWAELVQQARDASDAVEEAGAELFASEDDPYAEFNGHAGELGLSDCAENSEGGDEGEANGETVDVTAIDYGYEGLPASIAAGTAIHLINSSTAELHEFVAIKLPDDETRSAEELFALPEAELDALFGTAEPVTVILAPPGSDEDILPFEDGGVIGEPGRYIVACAIPLGADPEAYLNAPPTDGPPEVEGGPPHFTQGMYADLVVE